MSRFSMFVVVAAVYVLASSVPAVWSQESPVALTPEMKACAGRPTGRRTGAFIDRQRSDDLRVVSYNVNRDEIFPDKDQTGAEKFQRVAKALGPDILNLQEIRERTASDVVALMNAVAPLAKGATWHAYKGWTNVIVSKYPLKMTGDRTVPPGQRELAFGLVDLPDKRLKFDVYFVNNHWKCCGGTDNDPERQQQADAVVNRVRDARTAGGSFDLPPRTPIIIAGGQLDTVASSRAMMFTRCLWALRRLRFGRGTTSCAEVGRTTARAARPPLRTWRRVTLDAAIDMGHLPTSSPSPIRLSARLKRPGLRRFPRVDEGLFEQRA